MEKLKIYISGPMTGLPNYNREAFNAAAEELKDKYHVINPAVLPDGLEYDDYIDIAKILIKRCDAIYLLPGWQGSKGANIEYDFYNSVHDQHVVVIAGIGGNCLAMDRIMQYAGG